MSLAGNDSNLTVEYIRQAGSAVFQVPSMGLFRRKGNRETCRFQEIVAGYVIGS